MESLEIIRYLSPLLFFLFGFIVCYIFLKKSCDGELYLFDDEMYLNVSKTSIEKFQNNNFVMFQVKRRNFNGFNDKT